MLIGVRGSEPVFRGAALAGRTALRAGGTLCVGDNAPYRSEPEEDYTVRRMATRAEDSAAMIEVRQDLLGDDTGVGRGRRWRGWGPRPGWQGPIVDGPLGTSRSAMPTIPTEGQSAATSPRATFAPDFSTT